MVYPETPCPLTPGSFLRLHVLYAPCSNTSTLGDSPDSDPAGAGGAIRLVITWVAADGTTSGPHTHALPLDAPFPDGELPSGAGQLWGQIYEAELTEIWPPGVDNSKATNHTFSEGCTVLVEVQLQGGARILDCAVVEHPWNPDAECAHPANTGSTVWSCSDDLPEPYEDEPPCLWNHVEVMWSCFNHPCAQDTELGAELGLDPDVWVCEFVFIHTCTLDPFGEEDPFDCPAECELEGDFMTCPDFECEYSPTVDIWHCG